MKQLLTDRGAYDLDGPSADRKQGEFDCLKQVLLFGKLCLAGRGRGNGVFCGFLHGCTLLHLVRVFISSQGAV